MDLQSLRYFVAAAERESVTAAAEAIPISPGSVTKAVQRLEAELGVKLFSRVGRRLRLTAAGRDLLGRARELLRAEEDLRVAVAGSDQAVHLVVAGEEALLGSFAPGWMEELRETFPAARFELRRCGADDLAGMLRRGEVQVGFTTRPRPGDLAAVDLGEVEFVTCVGRDHPLGGGRRRRRIRIARLLEHGFVVPGHDLLGATGDLQSADGWRDDVFPREVLVRATSLHQVLAVVGRGLAVAYLPDYLAREHGLEVLTVTGCDYTCVHTARLLVHPRRAPGWLRDHLDVS